MREHSASDIRLAAEFGARIKERRIELGYTQEALALLVGANRRAIREIESGKPTSYLGLALSIGEALGVKIAPQNANISTNAVNIASQKAGLPGSTFKLPS